MPDASRAAQRTSAIRSKSLVKMLIVSPAKSKQTEGSRMKEAVPAGQGSNGHHLKWTGATLHRYPVRHVGSEVAFLCEWPTALDKQPISRIQRYHDASGR